MEGKVVVVAGGAGLIGEAVSRALSAAGAAVILADIDKGKGTDIAGKLANARFHKMDITSEVSVKGLIRAVDKRYARLDAWVNCAYPRTADWGSKLENIPVASWKKNMNMQLGGCFISSRAAAEYMKRKKRGSIVNFSSIYGINAPDFSVYAGTKMTTPAAYSALKAGVINFTKYLAAYYGKYNVRANCVSPGGVFNGQPGSFVKKYCARTPLGRMATPFDIAGAVVYLSSDASCYVTGHNLVIDGGWSVV